MDLLDNVDPSNDGNFLRDGYAECITRLTNELQYIQNLPMYAVMNKQGVCITNAAEYLKLAILELEKLQGK